MLCLSHCDVKNVNYLRFNRTSECHKNIRNKRDFTKGFTRRNLYNSKNNAIGNIEKSNLSTQNVDVIVDIYYNTF